MGLIDRLAKRYSKTPAEIARAPLDEFYFMIEAYRLGKKFPDADPVLLVEKKG